MRIDFFGHFGSLNTGNESTLLAVLWRLRELSPDSSFRCICTNPRAATAAAGIPAIPISTRENRIWDREVPFGARVRRAWKGLREELQQYIRAFRALRDSNALIIPGTGLLTDAFFLSDWGPYSLFKWSLMAKASGCKLLFVSVGAGPVDSWLGRRLLRASLSMADYRSYRDEASRQCLRDIGFPAARDDVFPDLVFSLPNSVIPRGSEEEEGKECSRVVGIGLMAYDRDYSIGDSADDVYLTYLECLVAFAGWLLDRGYYIRLLVGDSTTDAAAVEDFKARLGEYRGAYDGHRVVEQPIATVAEVLRQLRATDVVVATRFHNVVLALRLNKPTIAISFHCKCAALMNYMKLTNYCHRIDEMSAELLIRQFEELEATRGAVKSLISSRVAAAQRELDEQYDRLREVLVGTSRPSEERNSRPFTYQG